MSKQLFQGSGDQAKPTTGVRCLLKTVLRQQEVAVLLLRAVLIPLSLTGLAPALAEMEIKLKIPLQGKTLIGKSEGV